LPKPVADELRHLYQLIEEWGPFNPDVDSHLHKVYEDARENVASLLNAKPTEIALTRNVSDGINIVSAGFDWSPGDEVIISDEEHPSGILPWLNLAKRRGVVVKLLRLTPDPTQLLERMDSLINSRTRMVFMSHVSYASGLRIPAKDVCSFVREKGIPIMLDGAHAVGQLKVDVKELGCDFYSACGHKWLLAPQGTGFLYLKEERLKDVNVSWCGWGMNATLDMNTLSFEPLGDARKFEYGTRAWALYGGLVAAIKMARGIGLERIEARTRKLATMVKEDLKRIPGVEVVTPFDPDRSCGIVKFNIPGLTHINPGQWLWEKHRILVAGTRLSVAYFLLEEELYRTVECIASLIKEEKDFRRSS
jgi:isopenicillin-N epimerase/cysteine desulfurase/selenocysteine lyase